MARLNRLMSVLWGIDPLKKEGHIENQLLNDIKLNFHRRQKRVHIALDGELTWLYTPLQYRLAPDEIMVVMPAGKTDSIISADADTT